MKLRNRANRIRRVYVQERFRRSEQKFKATSRSKFRLGSASEADKVARGLDLPVAASIAAALQPVEAKEEASLGSALLVRNSHVLDAGLAQRNFGVEGAL